MAGPLLETKLHVPVPRRALVARPRLSDRLNQADEQTLILVSAPVGFGKTTALTEWLAEAPSDGRLLAWLSLDQRDNDPTLFWTYLIAALDKASNALGAQALATLRSPQSSTEAFLTILINGLQAIPNRLVLVLDDYHVIDNQDLQEGLAFLLENMPAHLQLVIASRADPALPLARLRARGRLLEIRAADLRFTLKEAAAYFNGVMGLGLTAKDIAALEGRAEGWIAALQLAALSMQGRDDVAGFIAGFAGDDRYIVDYLVEEVLQRQNDDVRNFLLQTSILNRLNGPLCDALTGQNNGKAMLESLDRGNLFVVPLDDRRWWYRYHHLFADVLRARLMDEQPGRINEMHERASLWHEQNGDIPEAIRHATAGKDFERAADLIELAIPAMRKDRQEATLSRWLEALPGELIHARPGLSVAYAGALLASGELTGVDARLLEAEQWVRTTAEGGDGGNLTSSIAIYRAAQALAVGNAAGAMTHATTALGLVGKDDHLERGAASGLLALGHWTNGKLGVAHGLWTDSYNSLERAGHHSDMLGCSIAMADIRITQGRLRDAMAIYERGLEIAGRHPEQMLRGTADMHVGMSRLLLDRGELEAAKKHVMTSQKLSEDAALPQNPYRSRVAMARILQAEGDVGGALEQLDEAERLYVGDFFPVVHPVAAVRARMWISQGRTSDALHWARERGISTENELSYLHEFEHITLARALLAQHRKELSEDSVGRAIALLVRLLRAAEGGGRTGTVVELLVLMALARKKEADDGGALAALQRAVALAAPEGYVSVFVDEGEAMANLLESLASQGSAPDYVDRLLESFGAETRSTRAQQRLLEPLSERELQVLRLLSSELGGPEIARELLVSLNTLRTHTKNIYAKLGANNRRSAVRRAEELNLLSRKDHHINHQMW
ncbi:LuxR C-terminal-related transcriptional regulator [Arthrobacter sp. efr-133-R2A-120]|uniref:LuxR C-terminal-related transcriptional regulator n=1 Tax=Arthrobacter sp. efr-133-R2A-120 TaxID=3040277 RepID=UPI00254FED71|nr:LuxR C-terminal-related transcriptional regulator [Arthrobacter sp. efr-133-R2A-120]